jgi:hypothetical protein
MVLVASGNVQPSPGSCCCCRAVQVHVCLTHVLVRWLRHTSINRVGVSVLHATFVGRHSRWYPVIHGGAAAAAAGVPFASVGTQYILRMV